jgi:type VII secretion integral membrane protein EccD
MSDSLCRLTVQYDRDNAVDLALPNDVSVGSLMPSIIDIVQDEAAIPVNVRRWRLSRIGGPSLDDSLSLAGNEIQSGETVLLTTEYPPAPEWFALDPAHTVAGHTQGTAVPRSSWSSVCCVSLAAVAALALAIQVRPGHAMVSAALSVLAGVAAVLAYRRYADPWISVPLAVDAVLFAAAAGFAAITDGPPAPRALLTSAAAFSVAMILARVMDCGTESLTAIATTAILTAAAALIAVIWQVRSDACGAFLVVLSLAVLTVAPRISMAMTGTVPAVPGTEDDDHEVAAQALCAHRTLSGLIAGTSVGAALGVTAAAVGELRSGEPILGIITLSVVIGLVLILRGRVHAVGTRRVTLVACGIISTTVGFAICVVSFPGCVPWVAVLTALAATAVLGPRLGITAGPVAHRFVEILDYVVLAATVPLACWVGGVLEAVRGMSVL